VDAADAADGQLTWVERSVDEEATLHNDSTVQQLQQEAIDKLFKIPQEPQLGHKTIIVASEVDLTRWDMH
jgi:hypothetical protein